jgi:integrase
VNGPVWPRAGLTGLRHSAATAMLRSGGSLGEIGQVLRHRPGRSASDLRQRVSEGRQGVWDAGVSERWCKGMY